MKFETLIKGYKRMGYTPINSTEFDEVNNICKWLFENHKVYVGENFMNLQFEGKHLKFCGFYRINIDVTSNICFYCDKYFINPFEARCDALRKALPGLRFTFKYMKKPIENDKKNNKESL